MGKSGAVWNIDKTKSVVLSKLKEFSIEEIVGYSKKIYSVKGWYNKENYFEFGLFGTEDEARDFIESIHKMF